MNRREIYFLCKNESDDICLNYPNELKYCRYCRRLKKYNLFEKIENEKTFKLIYLIDQITDHILKYKRYCILPELKDKYCDINHFLE